MATIITETFNTYNDGDLNGQGGWTGDTNWDVQGTVVREGAKAIACSATGTVDIQKTASQVAAGTQICYVRKTSNSDGRAVVWLEDDSVGTFAGIFRFAEDGKTYYAYGDSGVKYAQYGTYVADTWYCLHFEWNASTQVRYKVNDGAWTDLVTMPSEVSVSPDTVVIRLVVNTASTAYLDYFAEAPWSSSSSSSSSSFSSSSSSCSSSSFSSSSSSSSSSSISTYPTTWGIAWGEQNPIGESPESWATWSDGAGGNPTIIGDADWGKLQLGKDEIAHSPVHYFNALDSQTTLTENKYGSGVGSFKLYYRESDTTFNQDDVTPAWNLYTNPVRLTKAFRQVKLVGE